MDRGASNSQGNSYANGPAIAGSMNWEQAELMASQSNQWRDGQ